MERLSYETLEKIGYDGYLLREAPERVLQFGEGNFLRAFVDCWIDKMNEKAGFNSKVVMCQPIAPGLADMVNEQEGLYTLILRGNEGGKKVDDRRVISCVSKCLNPYKNYEEVLAYAESADIRFIVCNTTEAGIHYDPSCQFADVPADSYPGKLTQWLYRRFQKFGKEKGKGVIILSCELIDNNGKELEKCVNQYADQWDLGEPFKVWLREENVFCSTLVDRIVPGYPRAEAETIWGELGYQDNLLDVGEVFGLWVIEGPQWMKKELPFEEAGLPVIICDDHRPYKQRKVRILNGAHTSMVLGAYLAGKDIVRDCMRDDVIRGFMNKIIYDEIIPTLTLPEGIVCSFAFYIAFYHGQRLTEEGLTGSRGSNEYTVHDDRDILEFYEAHQGDSASELAHAVCTNTAFWGEDLSRIRGFEEAVIRYLTEIRDKGTYEVMRSCL